MLKRPMYFFSSGMMLMECLFAIAISGIMFVCLSRAYPQLLHSITTAYHQYRLDIYLRERLVLLETELRRTGYCKGHCGDQTPLKITTTNDKNACVIFAYDMNNNGHWDNATTKESDYFAYRIRQGELEQKRGATSCQSTGWQHFFEHNEINVTAFSLKQDTQQHGVDGRRLSLLSLSMSFELKQFPEIKSVYQSVIFLRNVQ